MRVLTKEGDVINLLAAPDEDVRLGESIAIDNIIVQIIDIQFADVPGVLEHLLRKSLVPESQRVEYVQPQLKSVLDTLADHKLLIGKIRGRMEGSGPNVSFKRGLTEFNLSRTSSRVSVLDESVLFRILGLPENVQRPWGRTTSTEPHGLDFPAARFGINLITGMKESGKSYASKKLLLRLIEQNIVTIVFDLNAEYVNLWKRDNTGTPNGYAPHIRILTPYLLQPTAQEVPFRIPLNEISADDFAHLMNVPEMSAMHQNLMQFWNDHRGQQFDLNDLEQFVNRITQLEVRTGLQTRVRTASGSRLFGPMNFAGTVTGLEGGGALILNLAGIKGWQRKILVSFVLSKLDEIAENVGSIAVFFEEAHLYVESQNIIDIVTRMRHLGIYPTFITNVPSTLPPEIYTLLDNLVGFAILNEADLNHIARSGKIDQETIATLKLLEQGRCMIIGRATANYPLYVEITPVGNVVMGGETRPLASPPR
jgi:hypothetical protein